MPIRRFNRILLDALGVLSFLLLLATLAAWYRGHHARVYLAAIRESTTTEGWTAREYGVTWGGGDVGLCYSSARADLVAAREANCPDGVRWGNRVNRRAPQRMSRAYADWAAGWIRAGHRATVWHHAGINAGHAQGHDWASSISVPNVPRADRRYYWFILPCWIPVLLFTLLPAHRTLAFLLRRRRARRTQSGLCPSCGYDLRATPDRCPECGQPAPVEAQP